MANSGGFSVRWATFYRGNLTSLECCASGQGYVKVKLAECRNGKLFLRLSDASGYVEGTGSSAN